MSAVSLNLTCRCGASLRFSAPATYTSTMRAERVAFDEAHEGCRQGYRNAADLSARLQLRRL